MTFGSGQRPPEIIKTQGMSSPPAFSVDAARAGQGFAIEVAAGGEARSYVIANATQHDVASFYRQLAADFGTRVPHRFAAVTHSAPAVRWKPLLTENIHPQILCGYGDPAVLKTEQGYWLVATSNDAPDAFPILHSVDLEHWHPHGFAFPEGAAPAWTATGRNVGDFWAPEMARVGDEYWLVYSARQASGALAIGLARSSIPTGPWVDNGSPLITGAAIDAATLGLDAAHLPPSSGVIDSHIFVEPDGTPFLLWKEDRNGLWPRPLAMLLRGSPALIDKMFESDADRRTAAFGAAIVGWANQQSTMVRFFMMQPLIEAALANWARVRAALEGRAPAIIDAMTTPVRVQRLAADGRGLVGESRIILTNDLEWEGHLIEGPFVTRHEDRYYLFYAGNDFSTPSYGIGVASADDLLGPYVKQSEPLLRSSPEWLAPGHASVAPGLSGEPQLFFHAFHPDSGGYNEFRALLTVGLRFENGQVSLTQPD
jgi:arabinan endo-1,5-alpha-L-arabinosidase